MIRSSLLILTLLIPSARTTGQERDAPRAKPEANLPTSARGTPEKPLELADVEELALRHNPTLTAAAARIEAARGRKVQAGLYPNPVVGYHSTEVGNQGTAGQQGGFITQRFITAGKVGLDEAIAGQGVRAAHFDFHAQEQRVLSDVRVRFWETRLAQRRVQLTSELARIGEELVEATRKLVDGRLGTENDLLQAEIKADEAVILLDNARNQHRASWRRLAASIGQPRMELTPLTGELGGELPDYDWDDSYQRVLGANPRLAAARARVKRARIAIERAQREPIPDIDISVSHRQNTVARGRVTNVQVGIPLPVFDQNEGNIRAAEAEWVAACRDLKRIELDLQDQLAVTYRRYANARHQTQRYTSRMLPRAKRSLQLVTSGFKQNQVEYLTLLIAQQTYLQVNLSYLDALQELQVAASLIEGQLLSDALSDRR